MFAALAPIIGAAISGGMNFLGAQRNSASNEAANLMNYQIAQQNLAMQQGAHQDNLALQTRSLEEQLNENARTRAMNLGINADNIALQREFARSGIQMRVADAKAAGINPLAALGGTGATFSPVAQMVGGSVPMAQGSTPNAVSGNFTPDTSMGNALAATGQDISRAINAVADQRERDDTVKAASQVLGLENQKLQNELLKSQVAKLRQTPNPPMPTNSRYLVDGQTQSGALVENKPMERTPADPKNLHAEPAATTDIGYARTARGSYAVVPSKDVKDKIEDVMPYEWSHFIRNALMPSFSSEYFKPPPVPLKQGHGWAYNPFLQEYHQVQTRFDKRFRGQATQWK